MLRAILILIVCVCAQAAPRVVERITQLYDTTSRISGDGYYSETYHVTTSDGYILEINRIPYGRYQNESNTQTSKPVVFLMHGLQSSAISYILAGPDNSIAYNLADAGFDVWMGNARGVLNSRNHVRLNPDGFFQKYEFFDFTFEEIALIDLPAMIDFVLENTGRTNLNYIGHSQGGTVFLILNSMKPEYNQKFASVHLLAGVGYQRHFPTAIIKRIAQSTEEIYDYARAFGVVELLGPNSVLLWEEACNEGNGNIRACELAQVENIVSRDTSALLGVIVGAATKQYAHYGQNVKDRRFRRWDHGTFSNLIRYGSFSPPDYDLKLITADVVMHYTVGDILLHENDVLAMADAMANTRVRKIARDTFSHTDFVIAPDATELVTNYIIEQLKSKNQAMKIVS